MPTSGFTASMKSQAQSLPNLAVKKGKKPKHALKKQAEAVGKTLSAQVTRPQLVERKASKEARQPPSKESGGVPDPTPQYLLRAHGPPSSLPEPRRILVIMDLNGTLLHRPSKKRPFHFVERPHAKQFLNYCLDNFYVAIWSSARPDNVNKMVARLLTPEQCAKCLVVWGRDQFGLSPEDYDARVQCYKRLTTIWGSPKIMQSRPAAHLSDGWDQTNTVLVDDSLEKARTEPHNLLEIPEFAGLQAEAPDVLPQVHDYLNGLCFQADISRYIRENPFKLDPRYSLMDRGS